jgi:predicted nucleic acid-binding protein
VTFLLDTNVVSEWAKPHPNPGVAAWLDAAEENSLFISVITLGELRLGIESLPKGVRRSRLDAWLTQELEPRFEARTFVVGQDTADLWARITARRRAAGRPISVTDAYLAATAEEHHLTVVTRNVADFTATGVRLINPWTGT